MNFNIGDSSFQKSSSSSDSSEFDQWITDENEAMEREQQIVVNLFINNNRLIHQLNHENNHASHRCYIVGHAVILRGRQNAHRNLYNDYFLIIMCMVKESFIVDLECQKSYFFTLFMLLNNMTTTSTNDVMHLVDLDYQLYIR